MKRTRDLTAPVFRVAFHNGGRWELHPTEFSRPDPARTFGAQSDPRGYAVETSSTGWPVAVLWCDPDLAVEIVQDLIAR